MSKKIKPVHPGEIIKLDMLKPMKMSAYRLAKGSGISLPNLTRILKGERAVTGESALRLGRFFGTGPEFWINVQARYDLEMAKDKHGSEVEAEVEPWKAA